MISASDRVAAVLARDERLLEVFVQASPAFEKLRNAAMRKTMARLVTVEQAARIAGIDAGVLVERLNRALAGRVASSEPSGGEDAASAPATRAFEPVPDALRATPPQRLIDLDVREDLRAGREPFRRIMGAARSLSPGEVLRVRAIFEPVPLYAVLGNLGLAHATEQLADDDFRVWFHHAPGVQKRAAAPRNPVASAGAADGAEASFDREDVVVLDVRGLEPPEPMVRTLAALARMPRGKTLVQLNVRVPRFLLPKLDERGFIYEVREQSPELVRLFIRHKPS